MKTISEIAEWVGGTVEGDAETGITGLAGLREARGGDLSFLAGRKYEAMLADTKAAAVLVNREWSGESPCPLIRVDNPDSAMTLIALELAPAYAGADPGIHPSAVVADDAEVGTGACIGPLCVVESGAVIGAGTVLVASCAIGARARIGKDCIFHAHVSVREGCRIGARTIIHDGAVIGADGFGYQPREDGRWIKIPQVGTVEIGDDVEIGANAAIDRARFGCTRIGNGVKIDNLVQVAHNVVIGDNSILAGHAAVAGSTVIGRHVQMAGKSSAAGHITIGDNSILGGNTGVARDLEPGSIVMGFAGRPHLTWKRILAAEERLPGLVRKVKQLERQVEALTARDGSGAESA